MISSPQEAHKALHFIQGKVPVEAIEYLRELPTSSELTQTLLKALEDAYPSENGNLTALLYAIVAEKHITEELIDPVIKLYVSQEDEWWPMSLQGRYLLDLLVKTYPEQATQKVIEALQHEVDEASMMPYYNLYEAFYFSDLQKFETPVLNLYQDEYLSHAKVLSKVLSDAGMQAAIPAMEKWKKRYEKNRARYASPQDAQMEGTLDDYINRLQQEADQLPDTSTTFLEQRPEWKTFLAGVFSKLQEHHKSLADLSAYWNADMDEEEDGEAAEDDTPAASTATQAPETIDWSKVGRNDPCPCGSGKKFKKCCMNKYA